jgi:glycosyltransferase involved in cell wall biosynthesis
MKILFLPSWYPNNKSRYDGNFIQNHAKALAGLCEVTVLFCTSDMFQKDGKYKVEINENRNLKEIIIYFQYHPNVFRRFIRKTNAYRMGLKQCGGYDVIHSHVFFMMGIFASILSKWNKKKIIHTEHSSEFHKLSGWRLWVFGLLKNQISFYTPVSQDLKNTYLSYGVEVSKIKVIPNTIDTHYFKILDRKPKEKIRFLHISAYQDPRKNTLGILIAFYHLCKKYDNIELEFGGDGDRVWFQKQIRAFEPIREKLILKGKYNDWELIQTYNEADCFVLFSAFENFGMVLAESLSCGTPVIATRVGGVVDFINDTNGILIEKEDETALYHAMESIILKKHIFEPQVLRDSVINYVGMDPVGEAYLRIYKELLMC